MNTEYRVPVGERDRVRAGLATQMIALGFGVPMDEITSRGRLGLIGCRARWLSIYLAHVGYGWPLERVSHAFGVNRVTAGKGCRWAEDVRDDPAIDDLLERLTELMRQVCEAPRVELSV